MTSAHGYRNPITSLAILMAVLACAVIPAAADTDAADPIPRVSLRLEKRTGKIGKHKTNRIKGTLRFSDSDAPADGDAEAGATWSVKPRRGRAVEIPLDEIYFVSMGQLGLGTEVDWVVRTMTEGAAHRTIGIRDGSRLGVGPRTDAIGERVVTNWPVITHLRADPYETMWEEGEMGYLRWYADNM